MKNKILSFLLFLLLIGALSFPVTVSGSEISNGFLQQQVEILRQEITTLRNLIANFNSRNNITAASYIAVNLSDNSTVLEKNTSSVYSIASITKLMTAVITLENIDLNQEIILTEEMLRSYGHSPSLYLGLRVSAENLLRANLIQSVNDAAESLSYFLGKEIFIALMNEKATEIGMKNTTFHDPHGLSRYNTSTAKDISKLLSYIHKNHPQILDISKDNNFWLPDATGKMLKFRNTGGFYYFPSFIGGKTGYTHSARQTAATIFEIKGNPVAIVILYSNNRQADTFAVRRKLLQ